MISTDIFLLWKSMKTGCKMAQAVVTPGAVPALTAVQVRFRRALEAPPGTLACEAALPPLYLHGIVLWDEHHKKVRLGSQASGADQRAGGRGRGPLDRGTGRNHRGGRVRGAEDTSSDGAAGGARGRHKDAET
jgi:hypothetical protein